METDVEKAIQKDLKKIEVKYGTKMKNICSARLQKILEFESGLLPKLMEKFFSSYKNLGQDIEAQNKQFEFEDFMLSQVDFGEQKVSVKQGTTAQELLAKAGYVLYPECKTEAEIQSFRHYYYRKDGKTPVYQGGRPEQYDKDGEELCTFNGGRLSTCRIWFAVKKNVADIKRENFKEPYRQDEYGTSVISIQFTRNTNSTLSIKNRYNHHVTAPDNTFSNNLDNIIEGLTDAFEKDYGVRDVQSVDRFNFELEGYVLANNGKLYPYNQEINNVYYCANNAIVDNLQPIELSPSHQVLADYFIVDTKEKTVRLYDKSIKDSFVDELTYNQKIDISKDTITIKKQDGGIAVIKLDQKKQIIGFEDNSLRKCGDKYLAYNGTILDLSLPNLQECGDEFLYFNKSLNVVDFPQLSECGDNFLKCCSLSELKLPNLKKCGKNFLYYDVGLEELNFPQLQWCASGFLANNKSIKHVNLPQLERCNGVFLFENESLVELNLPKLRACDNGFMQSNSVLQKLYLPLLEECGDGFLLENNSLTVLDLPKLRRCGDAFMEFNTSLLKLNLPQLQECEMAFLRLNNTLVELNLPSLEQCGYGFMRENKSLKVFNARRLQSYGNDFFRNNEFVREQFLSNLQKRSQCILQKDSTLIKDEKSQ